MSNKLNMFLKQNKKVRENTEYAATKSLCDENGEPLKWTIKPLSTRDNESIREACTIDVPITGKPGMYRQKLNTAKYMAKLICASVVEPNLYNKELQDSYGAMTPEELVLEMIDNPGEYSEFAEFVQQFNGFDETLQDKVNEAKN